MFLLNLFLIIVVTLNLVNCDKCDINGDLISCDWKNAQFDIKQYFHDLSKQDSKRSYYRFEFTGTIVNGILPEDVFSDYQFAAVFINDLSLTKIHTRAFDNSKVTSFICNCSLVNYEGEFDIYKALNSCENLEWLSINYKADTLHEIPDFAFKSKTLEYIMLHGGYFYKMDQDTNPLGGWNETPLASIASIGHRIIYKCPMLEVFKIRGFHDIQQISPDAFKLNDLERCSVIPGACATIFHMEIINNGLNHIYNHMLDMTSRNVVLNLSDNSITNVDNQFDLFFNNNNDNFVNLQGNSLLCSTINYATWIDIKNKNLTCSTQAIDKSSKNSFEQKFPFLEIVISVIVTLLLTNFAWLIYRFKIYKNIQNMKNENDNERSTGEGSSGTSSRNNYNSQLDSENNWRYYSSNYMSISPSSSSYDSLGSSIFRI